MKRLSAQQIKLMQQRLNRINWEPEMDFKTIDNVYQQLPKRHAGEEIADWLLRVFEANRVKITPISQVIKRAAADGALIEHPEPYTSDDERFRISPKRVEQGILVKIEAVGMSLDDFIHKTVMITTPDLMDEFWAEFELNDMADCEKMFPANPMTEHLFLTPGISTLIALLETDAS